MHLDPRGARVRDGSELTATDEAVLEQLKRKKKERGIEMAMEDYAERSGLPMPAENADVQESGMALRGNWRKLLLIEIQKNPDAVSADYAEAFGETVHKISDHIYNLKKEGLLLKTEYGFKITGKGEKFIEGAEVKKVRRKESANREKILALFKQGKTQTEIAKELGLSGATVSYHINYKPKAAEKEEKNVEEVKPKRKYRKRKGNPGLSATNENFSIRVGDASKKMNRRRITQVEIYQIDMPVPCVDVKGVRIIALDEEELRKFIKEELRFIRIREDGEEELEEVEE